MGKTRRKERILDDSFGEFSELGEYVSDALKARKRRDKRSNQPSKDSQEEELYRDEDYGSFEKIGKRR